MSSAECALTSSPVGITSYCVYVVFEHGALRQGRAILATMSTHMHLSLPFPQSILQSYFVDIRGRPDSYIASSRRPAHQASGAHTREGWSEVKRVREDHESSDAMALQFEADMCRRACFAFCPETIACFQKNDEREEVGKARREGACEPSSDLRGDAR